MAYLIGIDPGAKRTGVCVVGFDAENYALLKDADDLEGIPEVWDWLVDTVHTHGNPEAIIMEDYVPHRAAGNPRGLEVIGAVKAWAWLNYINVVMQSASGRKVAVPDEALRMLGVNWSGDKDRNWIEAVRHCVWYLKKQAHVPTLLQGWPSVSR